MVRYARIAYTYHARLRLVEREIPENVVAEVLAAPDQTYRDGDELVAERVLAGGKPWRVVYVEEPATDGTIARVVTVHRIRRLKAL